MSVAFTADPKRIFHISPPGTTKASEILELARFANDLTIEVETRWDEIPPKTQEALIKFAYRDWERSLGFHERLLARLRYTVLVLRGEEEVLNKLWNAANRLRRAVLDTIERNDPGYQKDLTEAIRDALSETDGRTMNAEQARERNRQIFDQVFD